MGYEKNFLITIIALVFVILKHSLQWRGEFHLYFGPVPEFLLVNSAARRFSMAASFEGKFLSSFLYWCSHWPYLVVQVYELITCVRRANENAGNLISVVQFLIINNYSMRARWDMKWYITNEARSAELVMIISYPASPSRIIVLLKTLRHIIENLKKKSERKESFSDQM